MQGEPHRSTGDDAGAAHAPALRADELQELVDLAPVAVIARAFGADTILSWRRGAEDLYGWTAAEAVGRLSHDLLQTRFPTSKEAVDAELRASGHWSGELTHVRKDGQLIVVASRQAVRRDASGQPTLILEINSDITERKHAEERLRQSEERFRLLVDNVADYAIFLLSPEGNVLTWNSGAQRLKGYTPGEIIGQSFTRFYTAEDAASGLPARLLRQAEAAGRVETEGWRVRKDGSRFWANVVITALHAEGGRLRGFAKITRDLTESREAEDARARASREEGARAAAEANQAEMRASRDQLAAILSGVAEGIMAHDRSGRIVYANDLAARLCGFSNAAGLLRASVPEIVARFDVFDESGQPLPRQQLPAQRVLLTGESVPETTLRFRAAGHEQEERWSMVQATPLLDDHGEVRQVISIFRDVSERKIAEDRARFLAAVNLELGRSLDYAQTLRRVAELAVPTLADWCVVDMRDESGSLRRLAAAHVDPDKVRLAAEISARYPDDPQSETGVANVLRTRQPVLLEDITDAQVDAAARDGDHLTMLRSLQIRSVIIVPLVARGAALGAISLVAAESGRRYHRADVALAEDLATRAALAVDNAQLYRDAQQQAAVHVELNVALRNAMTQLEQSLRTRDEFLASAAHDLKNPLTSIKAAAQLLQRRARLPEGVSTERLQQSLERIDAVATRASAQVDELLDVARMQMGRPLELDLSRVDLVALARELIAEHEQRSERHQLTLETSLQRLDGEWDQRRLARALGNLVDNAVKYSPQGGAVRVRVEREQDPATAVLTVEDQGIGIPSGDLERIFDRFERGGNVIGEIAGTGIGLTSTRHIVESHGGSISATSRPGHGTAITLRLPIAAPANPLSS